VNSLVDGLASSGLFGPTLFKGKVAFGPVFKNIGVLIAVFFSNKEKKRHFISVPLLISQSVKTNPLLLLLCMAGPNTT
jgi:hypothetical protein